MSAPIWYLYNATLALEYRCNTLGEIAKFLAARPFEERPAWFAWTAGMAEWTPVPKVLGLTEAPQRPANEPIQATESFQQTVNLEAAQVQVAVPQVAPQAAASINLLQTGPVASLAPVILQAPQISLVPEEETTQTDSPQSPQGISLVQTPQQTASETAAPEISAPEPPGAQTSVTMTPVGGRPLPQNWAERRKHPRIPLRLRIIIVSGGKTFRTFTKDVSQGGFMMEKPLPWSPGNELCTVYLSQEEDPQQIELRVRLLMQPGNPRRFAFQQTPKEFLARLQEWLFACSPSAAA